MKTAVKTLKQNVKFVQTHLLPFSFGLLTRRWPHSPNFIHSTILSTTQSHPKASQWGWVLKTYWSYQWDSSQRPSDSEFSMLSHCLTLPKYVLDTIDNLLVRFFSRNCMSFLLTLYLSTFQFWEKFYFCSIS